MARDLQKVIEALASPVRREIVSLIWDRELAAGEIAAAFSLTKPTISQHLSVLRQAGLVDQRVAGTSRRYRARREVLSGLQAALSDSTKWSNAEDVAERALADAWTKPVVVAAVDVPVDQGTAFEAFTDPAIYSRWLGVPVTIDDGWFACTLEWGTHVRGRYVVVHPPQLIVMRWDFEDANVPVPGGELLAYLQVHPAAGGSRVEAHQMVETPSQADFMELAWTTVLGRLKSGMAGSAAPRRSRPKQARSSKAAAR